MRTNINILIIITLSVFVTGFNTGLSAQVVIDHPIPNGAAGDYSNTWTVPANVYAITVEAWGGGAGASFWNNSTFDKGGQGGAYAKVDNYAVTPGDVINVTIGGGGPAGSYCGGNTSVSDGTNLILRALGGAFFFVNCVCYEYYVYPGTHCTADTSVNVIEAGQQTYTTAGGNAGGMLAGGGSGGAYPGGNGSVPGGGAASGSTGSRMGASGRVKISYVVTGLTAEASPGSLAIYPNPAAGIYHLSFGSISEASKDIFVYDVLGNIVYENRNIVAKDLAIDISGNAKGIYLVKVIREGKVYLSRLTYM